MTKFRLQIIDSFENVSFITRSEEGHIAYFAGDLTPLSLSNITHHAAELRFRLEDAEDQKEAFAATREYIYGTYTVTEF